VDLAQQDKSAVKVVEPLFPTDVVIHVLIPFVLENRIPILGQFLRLPKYEVDSSVESRAQLASSGPRPFIEIFEKLVLGWVHTAPHCRRSQGRSVLSIFSTLYTPTGDSTTILLEIGSLSHNSLLILPVFSDERRMKAIMIKLKAI